MLDYTRVSPTERAYPIIDLDCLNLNPNSYNSIGKVLDEVLKYANESGRNYIPCVMDGSPYLIALNMIRETYTCSLCSTDVSQTNIEMHEQQHPGEEINFQRKYKKIIIRPGK